MKTNAKFTITILAENHAGARFEAEHGLSYLIRVNGTSLLFDTGGSDLFIRNAKRLGIDLENEPDLVVLSHGHWDHSGGLQYLRRKHVIAHPDAFQKRYPKHSGENIGFEGNADFHNENHTVSLHREAAEIAPNIWFLGEIPRKFDFEKQSYPYVLDNGSEDTITDDSAIAIKHNDVLVLISGCAHAGICNTHAHAKDVTGTKETRLIVGGLHLKNVDHRTLETIQYFQQEQVKELWPSHCTELPALAAFHKHFGGKFIKTGTIIQL